MGRVAIGSQSVRSYTDSSFVRCFEELDDQSRLKSVVEYYIPVELDVELPSLRPVFSERWLQLTFGSLQRWVMVLL